MKWHFQCLVHFSLFWLSSAGFGQMITIRIIDAANGNPLAKQQISVSLLYDKGEKTPANYAALIQLETDDNGEVKFGLPVPAPAHLSASAHLTSEHWRCGCMALVATQDLIQKGFMETEPIRQSTQAIARRKPIPGEILFLVHPLTFLERLMYPFLKG